MNTKELKQKALAELQHLLMEARKKLDDLTFKLAQKQLKNLREIRIAKKDIAKLLTVIKEKSK
ncbi:MAG: 50S ribosomal protein L29 [bacterium]